MQNTKRFKLLVFLRDRVYKWKDGDKPPVTLNILFYTFFPRMFYNQYYERGLRRILEKYWARVHDYLLKKAKFKLVNWMFERNPTKYCWTDCVMWAISHDRLNPFKIEGNCKSCSESHSSKSCYCGVWHDGICTTLLSKEELELLFPKPEPDTTFPF